MILKTCEEVAHLLLLELWHKPPNVYTCMYLPFCFRCSTASELTTALSCLSSPFASFGEYCPAPPELSINDLENSTGPLDSYNAYVAEYLLRAAADAQPSVFFQQVQAGFVLSSREPSMPSCDDAFDDTNSTVAQIYQSENENLTVTVWYNNQVS